MRLLATEEYGCILGALVAQSATLLRVARTRPDPRLPSLRGRWPLLLGLLVAATPALANTLTGRVIGISDGDTITVLDANKTQHRVRLAGAVT